VPAEETERPRNTAPAARALPRRAIEAVLNPSPGAMRAFALAGVICTAGIIATGAAVRLSESGLGCPDWPQCTRGSLVAAHSAGDPMIHTWIEFGNRLVTIAITLIAVVVFVAAWRFRPGGRRRADLVWLAAAQPAGIVAQAVLGGIVVLTKLNPGTVALHFLASVAVLAAAVALHARCAEGLGPARSLVRADLRLLGYAVVAAVALMLAAGTVVSGTGPLAGAGAVPRFHLPLAGATQFHADIGWLLGGLAVPLAVGLWLTRAPAPAVRLGWALLGLIGMQGVIGYIQYFTGLPAGLVWVHVCGSTLIWIVALRLMFALRDRGPLPAATGQPAAGHRARARPVLTPAASRPGAPTVLARGDGPPERPDDRRPGSSSPGQGHTSANSAAASG
jgi:cytochrome c oxidase assembly protein subunit 15